MWIKTPDGKLYNLANTESVSIHQDPGRWCVMTHLYASEYRIHESNDKAACQQIIDDIEFGLRTGACFVDLLKRERFG